MRFYCINSLKADTRAKKVFRKSLSTHRRIGTLTMADDLEPEEGNSGSMKDNVVIVGVGLFIVVVSKV